MTNALKQEFRTPVGRLVQGNAFEAQTKNMQGQPLVTKTGQPTQRFFIAVAIRKDDPEWPAFWAKLSGVAQASFPGGQYSSPKFSWKVIDGDGVDDNGKPNSSKEGFAGHYVVKFSSGFAPRVFYAGRYQPHEQVADPKVLPRGYFVRVAGTIEGNGDAVKPGLYVNLQLIEIAGQGPVITSGPDAGAIFGSPAAQLPPGAAPLAPVGNGPQGMAPMGQPGMMPPGAPGVPVGAMPFGALGAAPSMMPAGQQFAPAAGPQAAHPGMAVMPNAQFMQGPGAQPPAMQPGMPGMMPMGQQPGFPPAGAAPGFGGMQPQPGFAPQAAPQQFAPMGQPGMAPMGYGQPQQPGFAPMQPMQPAGPAPGGQHLMLPTAAPYTYEQYIANGYNDATLRQQGLMQ